MHLVIPFAAPPAQGESGAWPVPRLPALGALLARLAPGERLEGDAYSLSTPHERVLAAALGWHGADGALPWAVCAAAADGLKPDEAAWGLLNPVHWQVGREHLTMDDPDALALDATESRAFFDAVRPLFDTEGWRCAWGAPTRWYVSHASLEGLACASPDRVIGRNPDLWMPAHPAARLVKRLQAEVQMLLYTHALNEQREARGLLPLNSFWLSGCGVHQPERTPAPTVLDALRAPALRNDGVAWAAAWQVLDSGPLRAALAHSERGAPLRLTLCGERHAQSWEVLPRGVMAALRARLQRVDVSARLAAL